MRTAGAGGRATSRSPLGASSAARDVMRGGGARPGRGVAVNETLDPEVLDRSVPSVAVIAQSTVDVGDERVLGHPRTTANAAATCAPATNVPATAIPDCHPAHLRLRAARPTGSAVTVNACGSTSSRPSGDCRESHCEHPTARPLGNRHVDGSPERHPLCLSLSAMSSMRTLPGAIDVRGAVDHRDRSSRVASRPLPCTAGRGVATSEVTVAGVRICRQLRAHRGWAYRTLRATHHDQLVTSQRISTQRPVSTGFRKPWGSEWRPTLAAVRRGYQVFPYARTATSAGSATAVTISRYATHGRHTQDAHRELCPLDARGRDIDRA